MRPELRAVGVVVACVSVLCLGGAGRAGPADIVFLSAPLTAGDSFVDTGQGSLSRSSGELLWRGGTATEQASVTVVAQRPASSSPAAQAGTRSQPATAGTAVMGDLGIPGLVLDAYKQAAARTAAVDASCGIRWEVLAGIGKVESGHAGGGAVATSGQAQPPIIGPALNGHGFAALGDSDGGRWDGDPGWDHAVGPMQFIPRTWDRYGVDGSGDGQADPHNVFDAALAAGHYLCAGSSDLSTDAGLESALLRYNHSSTYVAKVMLWIKAYEAGQGFVIDTPGPGADESNPPSPAELDPPPASPNPVEPSERPSASSTPTPSPSPTPTLTPSPTPRPSPSPAPTGTPRPTGTPTPTSTPTPTGTPSATPSGTSTPSPSGTSTPKPPKTPSPSSSPSQTSSPQTPSETSSTPETPSETQASPTP